MRIKARALTLLVALFVVGCGSSTSSSQPSITLGFVSPLSAPGAVSIGQLHLLAAQMGVEYINTVKGGVLGGRKLQLQVEDTKGQAAAGVAAYRQLVTQYHVPIVFGEVHSSVYLAESELAKQLGVPDMSTQATNPSVTGLHYNTAFSTITGDDAKAGLILKFIQLKGYKRVAMLMENTDYGTGVAKAVTDIVKAQNAAVTLDTVLFQLSAADITPQLLTVKAFKPDLIINGGSADQDVDAVISQAATIGIGPSVVPQLVSFDQPTEPGWWQKHATDGVGLYYVAYYSPTTQPLSAAGQWFATEYQKRYNAVAAYIPLNAFGQVVVIADALNQAKNTDPATLIKTLETGSFESWLATPATFPQAAGTAWHHWEPPLLVVQITSANEVWNQDTGITSYSPQS